MKKILIGAIPAKKTVGKHESPLPMTQRQRRTMTLSKIIGRFKMLTAKEINLMYKTTSQPVWQRNYYEHIIRNDKDLNNIREYIVNNPMQWQMDEENPVTVGNFGVSKLRREMGSPSTLRRAQHKQAQGKYWRSCWRKICSRDRLVPMFFIG